jgi:membrane protein implicated in regulation of membrane protease activity
VTRIDLSDPAAIRRENAAWPWRIVFLAYAVLLVIATHWPGSGQPGEGLDSPDKLMHFLCFGGFALLLWMTGWFRRFWTASLIALAFTILAEATQSLLSVNREASGLDIAAGILGVMTASAWMSTFGTREHLIVRQQELKSRFILDELMGSPTNWILIGAAFGIPTVFVSLTIYLLAWNVAALSIGNIALTIGLATGAMIGAGMVLRLVAPYRERVERDHPCFDCGESLREVALDELGNGTCPSCGHAVHASQWTTLSSSNVSMQQLLNCDGPVGLVCLVFYLIIAVVIGPIALLMSGHAGLASAILYTGIGVSLAMIWQWRRTQRRTSLERSGEQCARCRADLTDIECNGGIGTCPNCRTEFARHATVEGDGDAAFDAVKND